MALTEAGVNWKKLEPQWTSPMWEMLLPLPETSPSGGEVEVEKYPGLTLALASNLSAGPLSTQEPGADGL